MLSVDQTGGAVMIGFSLAALMRTDAQGMDTGDAAMRSPCASSSLVPVMQLFLFGFAINTNPKNLPTGLLTVEHSKYERTIVAALQNSGYYAIRTLSSETEAERALAQGDVLFVVELPPNFDRSVDRGDVPSILIDADASDPSAIGNATAALSTIAPVLNRDLPPVMRSEPTSPAFRFVVHARYNPEQLTVLNIVPGLMCIVLMMSTLFMTTLSITKERERGTMENLLAMPVRPLEVMLAKIMPFVAIGYIQVLIILASSALFFHCRCAARSPCCSWRSASSSPAISRSGLRSRRCRRTRCRRCSSPSSR